MSVTTEHCGSSHSLQEGRVKTADALVSNSILDFRPVTCGAEARYREIMALVDVVVVSYNSRKQLRRSVEHLAATAEINVLVVDNASTDGSLDVVADLAVTSIPMPRNGGFAYGCNAGWHSGSAPFVLFLNPDARLEVEALRVLVEKAREDERVGAVAPRINHSDGALDYSQRRFPAWHRLTGRRCSCTGCFQNPAGRVKCYATSGSMGDLGLPSGCRGRVFSSVGRFSSGSVGSTRGSSCTAKTRTSAAGSGRRASRSGSSRRLCVSMRAAGPHPGRVSCRFSPRAGSGMRASIGLGSAPSSNAWESRSVRSLTCSSRAAARMSEAATAVPFDAHLRGNRSERHLADWLAVPFRSGLEGVERCFDHG